VCNRVGAEFAGTFWLVLGGCGSAVLAASYPTQPDAERGSFTSIEDLEAKISAFIEYFNTTMAKPFKWTYGRQPLSV
jgi:glycerol uptake facilitator-like aquaporin